MCIKLMAQVWELRGVPGTDRLVLLSLADHADAEGRCFPSVGRLIERTGLSERTVQGALRRLSEGGFLTVEVGGGRFRANLYTLQIGAKTPQQMHPAADAPPQDMPRLAARNPAKSALNPAEFAGNPAADAPEPKRTIKKVKKNNIRDTLSALVGDDLADAVIEHRKRKRAALTERSVTLLCNEFAKTADPRAAAEEMLLRGWQGFKAEWMEGRHGQRFDQSAGERKSERRLEGWAEAASGMAGPPFRD